MTESPSPKASYQARDQATKQPTTTMRGRKSRIDLSTEAGRFLFKDLVNFKKTKFNPFVPESFKTTKFWKSRKQFQKVPYGAFIKQAEEYAKTVIAQMPVKERKEEEERLKKMGEKKKAPNKKKTSRSNQIQDEDYKDSGVSKKKSVRDPIIAPFPNGIKVLVLFEPDGDIVDESANKLEFAEDGRKIATFSRIPKQWLQANALIGNPQIGQDNDGDCMLLDAEIKTRLSGAEEDEFGTLWEPRRIIELPFPCHPVLFNKAGEEIDSYLLRKNKHGHAWGYFWLLSCESRDWKADDSGMSDARIIGESDSWENDESESSDDDASDTSVRSSLASLNFRIVGFSLYSQLN